MKRIYHYLILMTLLSFISSQDVLAQRTTYQFNPKFAKEGFQLLRADAGTLRFNHSLPGLALDAFTDNGYSGQVLELNGIYLPADAGAPNLPANSRFVAIPNGAKATLNILSLKKEIIRNVDLLPAAAIPLSNDDSPATYEKDDVIYSKDGFFPAQPFQISKQTEIRGVDAVMLSITPFQYNPVTKDLIVYYDIEAEIVFEGGTGTFGDDRLRNPWWDNIIQDNILNSEVIPAIDYGARAKRLAESREEGCEYLIIIPTGPAFAQWADTIRVFRQHQGITTKVVSLADVGGNTVSAIETYVNNAYNNWTLAPAAILLLGDFSTNAADGIISHTLNDHPGGYNPYISDNPFSDVTGDKLPDIAFARITARNAAELEHMIKKFLNYERTPPTSTAFYDHPITAMGWQTERWFQICSETVNGFWEFGLGKNPVRENAIYSGTPGGAWSSNANTATVVNYFGPNGLNYIPANSAHLTDWGGNATRVNNSINSGAFILQHRDHGFEQGWGEPDYGNTNLGGLTNADLTFVMSINCLTGKFNYSGECFAEKFHRHNYGALGLIAATEVSYSFVNDVYVWGAYDNMWPQFMPAYGSNPAPRGILPAFANPAGKYFLQQSSWPYNPEHKDITYNLFHHHGDAFMTVYSEVPQDLTVNHMPVLLSGMEVFEVTANQGAMIALTVNDEIIGVAIAGEGTTQVPIISQLPGNAIRITVTLQNYYRYEQVIECIPPSGPYMIYNAMAVNDPTGNGNGVIDYGETVALDMTMKNVGSEMAPEVNVTAASDSPFVTFINNSFSLGNVEAGATITAPSALQFTVADDVPDNQSLAILLTITSGSETWTSQCSVKAYAPAFTIGSFSISDPAGNGNGRLDPGETVEISFSASNSGHSASFDANATLTPSSPFISIANTVVNFNQIDAGQEVTAIYTVEVSGGAPVGSLASFNLALEDGAYTASKDFSAKIGLVTEDFETGDFSAYPWVQSGNQPWQITNVNPYAGVYSAKSGTISHSQSSVMSVQYEVGTADSISFYFKVSSESNYDFLRFWIGTVKMGEWSGTSEWTKVSFPVATGIKTFKWEYMKDNSVSSGTDCAWVDDIVFPAAATTSAWAGNDMSVCVGNTAQLNASASNYTSLAWTTSGSGTFSNPNIANPVYTPSDADYLAGNVQLTITATGTTTISDICTLSFNPAAEAFAGEGHTICPSETYLITDATATNYTNISWSTSGDGTFDDANALHPVYAPGTGDLLAGEVTLTLNAVAMAGCQTAVSSQTLSIYATPVAEAGTDLSVCAGGNVISTDAATAQNFTSLLWTSSGDGTFGDATTLITTYLPGTADETNGFATLYLTLNSEGGCAGVVDSLMLNVHSLPSISLGADQNICAGSEAVIELNLTGQGPWIVNMADPVGSMTIEATPFYMNMTPQQTTELVAVQITDLNCVATVDQHVWINVFNVPSQPSMPSGPDTVDFNEGFETTFILQEMGAVETCQARILPETAGNIQLDGTNLIVSWNADFRGEAQISVQISSFCGQSEWSETKKVEVKSTIGLNESQVASLLLYPNPVSDLLTIKSADFGESLVSIQLQDVSGKIVFTTMVQAQAGPFRYELPMEGYQKGVYFVQLKAGNITARQKLILQ